MDMEVNSVEELIARTTIPLLRRRYLNRDVVIGFIGERGGGKSVGAATVAALDWGIEGDIIRSNLRVAWDIEVSEELAIKYNLEPKTVHYESEELNKHKFLSFSRDYYRSIFLIDEINLWLADARRTMSTQNLLADDVTQQLRKWEAPLFYTCIHEMFVDSRIRDMTDIFIKTQDMALTEDGLLRRQRQGISFEWLIYPMTKKFNGVTFQENHRPFGPIPISGKMLWNIIDTYLHQERKKYDPARAERMPVEFEEDEMIIEERKRWGWLYEIILQLHQAGVSEVKSSELWNILRLKEYGISPTDAGKQLSAMGISKRWSSGQCFYQIDTFDMDRQESIDKAQELVVVS